MSVIFVSPESGATGCPGATEYVGSDRYAWFVNSVSKNGKVVVIERPAVQGNGEWPCHQHEFSRQEDARRETLVWRYGSWFVKEAVKEGKARFKGKMSISFGSMYEYRDPSF